MEEEQVMDKWQKIGVEQPKPKQLTQTKPLKTFALSVASQNSLADKILHSQNRQATPEGIRKKLEDSLWAFKKIGVKPVLKKSFLDWVQDASFRRLGARLEDNVALELSNNIEYYQDNNGYIQISYNKEVQNDYYNVEKWWAKDMKDGFYRYQLIDTSDFSIYCSFANRLNIEENSDLFIELQQYFQNQVNQSKTMIDNILGFSYDDKNQDHTKARVNILKGMLQKMFISLSEGFKSNTTLVQEADALIAYYPQLLDYSACAMDLAIEEYKKTHTSLNQQKFVDVAENVLKNKAIPFRENVDFLLNATR
jgi:hypothetical protein